MTYLQCKGSGLGQLWKSRYALYDLDFHQEQKVINYAFHFADMKTKALICSICDKNIFYINIKKDNVSILASDRKTLLLADAQPASVLFDLFYL